MEIQGDIASIPVTPDQFAIAVKRDFRAFLDEFQEVGAIGSSDIGADQPKFYRLAAREMRETDKTTLYVNFAHVLAHNQVLSASISDEYFRLEPYLREAVREFAISLYPDYEIDDKSHRRDFYVSFYNLEATIPMRQLRTNRVGTLIAVCGTVVRTSAVHPELISGTFQCNECRTYIDNVLQQFKYTQPTVCKNPTCQNRKDFHLVLEDSKFSDFQKVRIQEPSDEIPSGSMPRSLDVILRHEVVERAKAGDRAILTGTLVVVPDVAQLAGSGSRVSVSSGSSQRSAEGYSQDGISGLKALGVRDLTYKLVFLATTVNMKEEQSNVRNDDDPTSAEVVAGLSDGERRDLVAMKGDVNVYKNLSESIAPTVFGHDEVKKGILLMLFGGLHKMTSDGINLRGDINVCIVGDPSTSKSQFLKYVAGFVPRSVYTSGKASSAAGLTAAVVKDEDSNEFYVEAGALMLADNGVCCIDEFDKMEERDQVAIHEAMEQQTISISKAGIQATLKARTSILAAANPVNGRYDKSKSLRANVNMTGPIMSRFDLFFVIVDECNEVADYNIARHITTLHRLKSEAVLPPYKPDTVKKYIMFARSLKPRISEDAGRLIVQQYMRLRQGESSGINKQSYRITVRQLESVIRLSEALARVHCSDEVTPGHVAEACRLLKKSIIRVDTEDMDLTEEDAQLEGGNGGAESMDEEDTGPDSGKDGSKAGAATPSSQTKTPKSISYEKYMRIARAVIHFLRKSEESQGQGEIGVSKQDVVTWYTSQQEKEMSSETELGQEIQLVRLVIHRLVHIDHVLLEIGETSEGEHFADNEKLLVVHPNYVA